MKILLVLLSLWVLQVGCGPSQPPQTAAVPPVEYYLAKDAADGVARDLINHDIRDLYDRLDVGFHTVISDQKGLEDVVNRMYLVYGRPKECRFKVAKTNIRMDGGWRRTARTFIYAVRTAKKPFGNHFLRVEIVPAYNSTQGVLYVSGFGFFEFKNGAVPEAYR